MKFKIYLLMSLLFILKMEAQSGSENQNTNGFTINFDIPSLKEKKIYFGHYWHGQTYAKDSIVLSKKGKATLSLSQKPKGGQYFIYSKPDFNLDLLIDDNQNDISLYIDKKNFAKSTVSGSEDTRRLWDYLINLEKKKEERDEIENKLKSSDLTSSKLKELQDKLDKLNESMDIYIQSQIDENKSNWFGVFIKATTPIKFPYSKPQTKEDADKNREYGKKHYFDNIDLTDPRLWQTNLMDSQIENFFKQFVEESPDSLAVEASRLAAKTKGNAYCFKEMLSKLTNDALKSIRMGDESIWAKLAEDYIFDKDVAWIDSTQQLEIRAKYESIKNNRIGMRAHNLKLDALDGGSFFLDDIEADYILMYFYSPECGHCERDLPVIYNTIYSKYKDKGLEVLAINIHNSKAMWEQFISSNKLIDWYNGADMKYKSEYWMHYDVSGTPSIFILDKNKKIIAKKISTENIEKVLSYYLKD